MLCKLVISFMGFVRVSLNWDKRTEDLLARKYAKSAQRYVELIIVRALNGASLHAPIFRNVEEPSCRYAS